MPAATLQLYREYVAAQTAWLRRLQPAFPVHTPPAPRPALAADAPVAMIFSPHPDDECICGALPLRLLRQGGFRVVNVAVTQGSNVARQAPRMTELIAACNYLGFELERLGDHGFDGINVATRQAQPAQWQGQVQTIAALLRRYRPRVVFAHHDSDWNKTHVGVHWLVLDALRSLPADTACHLVEMEYWGAMSDPNLMVEMSEGEVTDLLVALAFHEGEMARNPYHVRAVPWFIDNVRRGAEVIGGQGGVAPDFTYATLYRQRVFRAGALHPATRPAPFIASSDPLASWFPALG